MTRSHTSSPKPFALAQMLCVLAVSPAVAASGYLSITVNDVETHYSVPALVKGDGPELFSVSTDETGLLKRALAPGEYRLEVSAPGYKSMKSRATVEAGRTSFLGFMLDPTNPPEEELLLPSRLRTGFSVISGYALQDRGRPVSDVRVRLQKTGGETVTDRRGYYWLSVRTPPETERFVPGTDTLIAEKPGYKTIIHRNIIIAGEDAGGVFLGMERGTGVEEHDDTHKMLRKEPDTMDERQPPPQH